MQQAAEKYLMQQNFRPIEDSPSGEAINRGYGFFVPGPVKPGDPTENNPAPKTMKAATDPVDRSSKKNDTPKSTPQEFKIAGFNGYLVLVVAALILMFSWD